MKKCLYIIAVCVLFSVQIFGQSDVNVIHLKDGKVIKGMLIELKPCEYYKIKTFDNRIILVTIDEIETITFENPVRSKAGKSYFLFNTGMLFSPGIKNFPGEFEKGPLGDSGFLLGVATGAHLTNNIRVGLGLEYNSFPEFSNIPVYADLRFNLSPERRVSPVLAANFGYALMEKSDNATFYNISAGFEIQMKREKKSTLFFLIGYRGYLTSEKLKLNSYDYDINYTTVTIGLCL